MQANSLSQEEYFNFDINSAKMQAEEWFTQLRDEICASYEQLEPNGQRFERNDWLREDGKGGGGTISLMKGDALEKVGVNISTVYGDLQEVFFNEMAAQNPLIKNHAGKIAHKFWASGISLVSHANNPLTPSAHFNTRFIVVGDENNYVWWFGGGGDLTPTFEYAEDTEEFHQAFKDACDKFDSRYYPKYKEQCDDYFYIKHREESRGIGGIFYDYHNSNYELHDRAVAVDKFSGNQQAAWQYDFDFTQDVGRAFCDIYPILVKRRMNQPFTKQQKHAQLVKRGRYAEFNLVYDRGTRFGFMTGGNTEAILMSLPPMAAWD